MRFSVERHDNGAATRITVHGEVDLASGSRLEAEILRAESEGPRVLLLDLREVTFFDSTGLQIVLEADTRARSAGRELRILAGRGEPRRLFELAEVHERLMVVEDPT